MGNQYSDNLPTPTPAVTTTVDANIINSSIPVTGSVTTSVTNPVAVSNFPSVQNVSDSHLTSGSQLTQIVGPAGSVANVVQINGNQRLMATLAGGAVPGSASPNYTNSIGAIDPAGLIQPAQVTTAKYLRVNATNCMFSLAYDSVAVAYPTSTQETYTSYLGGLSGTQQQVITINYTDSTKAFISNVARTPYGI